MISAVVCVGIYLAGIVVECKEEEQGFPEGFFDAPEEMTLDANASDDEIWTWAIGKRWMKVPKNQWYMAWNIRHGDIFKTHEMEHIENLKRKIRKVYHKEHPDGSDDIKKREIIYQTQTNKLFYIDELGDTRELEYTDDDTYNMLLDLTKKLIRT